MIALILGGSGSGKSEMAEQLCVSLNAEQKIYIATMYPWDEESRARIDKHRKMRAKKNFLTWECFYHLKEEVIRHKTEHEKGLLCPNALAVSGDSTNRTDLEALDDSHNRPNHPVLPDTLLLDCMSNLVANEMYCKEGIQGGFPKAAEEIMAGVEELIRQFKNVIIVSNDVFQDGEEYNESMQEYLKNLAQVNAQVAKRADVVVEAVCGIPVIHKGAKLYENSLEQF